MRRILATFAFFTGLSLLISPFSSAQAPGDDLLVTQWVCPAKAGEFKANVVVPVINGSVALPEAKVRLLGKSGKMLHGTTNNRGEVTIEGVQPGVYGMLVHGERAFACYAMHVVGPDHGEGCPQVAEISCAPVQYRRVQSAAAP